MAYLASDLVTASWYLSGIVARNLQVPTGDQLNDGLNMLNDLLNFKQIETELLPYYQYITFNAVPGQEYYFLPNIAIIEEMTFNLGVVRYPMMSQPRTNYFGSARVDNIQTLPFSYNYDRSLGGGNLAMYFIPDQNYPIKMKVKIFFTDVSLTTDLTDVLSLPGVSTAYTANQLTTTFTANSSLTGDLVINTQQPMSFGEQVQFIGGSIPSTLSLATTYYAVPVDEGSFVVATSLTNAQQSVYVPYASGTGSVTSYALVITLPNAMNNLFVGDEIVFTQGPGMSMLPPGISAGVIYYANPSSPYTFTLATSLANAQQGANILYSGEGTTGNTLTFINPNDTPYFTLYSFINSANQGYDTSYIEFLRYALARYFCSEYGVGFNPQSEAIYQSYYRKLLYVSPPDLSMKKLSILNSNDQLGYNWGDCNIGMGWRP